jgi:copper oxidase (laccase) domain-containing protein
MAPLLWDLPHGTHVAMSLGPHGDMRDRTLRESWCRRWALPVPSVLRQVHGCTILPGPQAAAMMDGDGLTTRIPGEAIGVFGADCPSLVIVAPDAIGVAHCGWRGTAAGIVGQLIDALHSASSHPPQDWAALVGPGVHPDDFEVDAPVLSARQWPPGCLRHGRPGRAWLDLASTITADCAAGGIVNVARCATTTSRDVRLRSYRRDGPGHPHILLAWRTTCAG